MCVGGGEWVVVRMVRTAAECGLRSEEESDASLAHAWRSVPPSPTFSLYTTQIFTVEVLISMHMFNPSFSQNNRTQERGYIFKGTFNCHF